MCFSRPKWVNWAHRSVKCLNIGTHCTLCARSALPDIDLCSNCLQQLRTLGYTDREGISSKLCPGCGLEQICLSDSDTLSPESCQDQASAFTLVECALTGKYCSDCAAREGRFLTRIVAPYRYAYPMDKLIKRVKYGDDRQLARVLGDLLAEAATSGTRCQLPQILAPMPLHPDRLRHRGFNQAGDIASWCGKRLGLLVVPDQVSRIVDTGSLAGLNRQERQHRILGAFRAGNALVGKRVAIIDDVLTTGASARELAREIYDSGAESVELWVLARTSSPREGS